MNADDLDLPPKRKKSKVSKYFPAFLAWFLILSVSTVYFIFPGANFAHETALHPYSWIIPIFQAVLLLCLLVNLAVATTMDPGFLPKAQPDEIPSDDFRSPLYKTIIINGVSVRLKWCVTCNFYRPPRTSHCSSCDRCLEVFDHHCPWVSNCVGRRNYRYFLLFLICLSLLMLSVLAVCVYQIAREWDNLHHPVNIVSMVLMAFIGLLIFPVGGLTCFHFHLVAKSSTTNEQVTAKFHGLNNPYDRGCLRNYLTVFCGPRYAHFASVEDVGSYSNKEKASLSPFSPAASPTPIRIELKQTAKESNGFSSVKDETAPRKPLSKHDPSPPYDNENRAVNMNRDFPDANPPVAATNPQEAAPLLSPTSPSSHSASSTQPEAALRSRMQPVIAELASKPLTSMSAGVLRPALKDPSFSQNQDNLLLTKVSVHPRLVSQTSAHNSDYGSMSDKSSIDQQRSYHTLNPRHLNSPRYTSKKNRAYGNALKDEIRKAREEPPGSPLYSKANSVTNLDREDLQLSRYKRNPAIGSSQPSLFSGENLVARKSRPPSFVQAVETSDSIEQLTLLNSKFPVAGGEKKDAKMKPVFGEISV